MRIGSEETISCSKDKRWYMSRKVHTNCCVDLDQKELWAVFFLLQYVCQEQPAWQGAHTLDWRGLSWIMRNHKGSTNLFPRNTGNVTFAWDIFTVFRFGFFLMLFFFFFLSGIQSNHLPTSHSIIDMLLRKTGKHHKILLFLSSPFSSLKINHYAILQFLYLPNCKPFKEAVKTLGLAYCLPCNSVTCRLTVCQAAAWITQLSQ